MSLCVFFRRMQISRLFSHLLKLANINYITSLNELQISVHHLFQIIYFIILFRFLFK